MKIGWMLGWAVPPSWFAPLAREMFPDAEHVVVTPAPDAWAQLETAAPFDWLVGYSLGSLLFLADAPRANRLGRVALLAPIFAFPKEEQAGGRVARTQLRYLARWLQRDRGAALADFHGRAGLVVPERMQLELATDDLAWGLAQLEAVTVPTFLPERWLAWCGSEDALLDARRLRELEPAIWCVPGATHHPRALLQRFSESLR